MGRVLGIDYDHKDKDVVRSALRNIYILYSPECVKLSISPSGRGYHIRFITAMDFSDDACLEIRKWLGDDPNRISIIWDGGTKIYRDVLFDAKIIDGKVCKCVPLDVGEFMRDGSEVVLNG
jgi:hypothetical protein